jgi:dCTP diphosphatase
MQTSAKPASPVLAAAKATAAVINDEQGAELALAVVNPPTPFRSDVTFEEVRKQMYQFAYDRAWFRYHTPRNLCLALQGEVGELAEIFMWRGDNGAKPMLPGWSEADKIHLGEELSDVLLYLIRLSDTAGIDLPAAALRKMEKNAAKYPAELCRGKSDKYTAYSNSAAAAKDGNGGSSGNNNAASAVGATGAAASTLKPSAQLLLSNAAPADHSTAAAEEKGEDNGVVSSFFGAARRAWRRATRVDPLVISCLVVVGVLLARDYDRVRRDRAFEEWLRRRVTA